MTKVCPDKMTADDLSEMKSNLIIVYDYFGWLELAVVIVCAIVLFGYYRKLTKPTFVWVMWGLFIVSQVAYLTMAILYNKLEKADDAVDIETYDRLGRFHNEAVTIYTATLMSGHWVFGIKYAEVVLKLPLIVFPESVRDIQTKLKKISCAIWTLNGINAALICIYILLWQLIIFGVLGECQCINLATLRASRGVSLANSAAARGSNQSSLHGEPTAQQGHLPKGEGCPAAHCHIHSLLHCIYCNND